MNERPNDSARTLEEVACYLRLCRFMKTRCDVNAGLPVVLDDGSQYVFGAGLVSQIAGANTYYYLSDGLGSAMKTVDVSGNVVNSYDYHVYGNVKTTSGPGGNEFQFAGQDVDGSTGLQYLRARYYDMDTGRFISRDPLTNSSLWNFNPFSYAEASPVVMADPMGLAPWDRPAGATQAEWDWCTSVSGNIKSGGQRATICREANRLRLREKAESLVKDYFGEDVDDGRGNAFKHCCWIGLLALSQGSGDARGVGKRHEQRNVQEWARDSRPNGSG